MERLLDNLTREIKDYYSKVSDLPLCPSVKAEEIREHLKDSYDFSSSIELEKLTDEVMSMLHKWSLHTNSSKYFGLYVPATYLASTIADALVALYNPQLGVWSHAPGACEIERHTLNYLMRKFGMDERTGCANFTTGGTEANLSAVLSALIKYFPEYGENGVRALDQQPVFYVSEEAHHSFLKVGQVTGLGYGAVRKVPTDSEFKIDMNALIKLYDHDISNNRAPFFVAATAGTTSAGVIDPLPEIANFCKENNMWFHVDAAYGGAAIMSNRLKKCLKGIERADSITCDAHKWFSVSMSAGMFFSKNKRYVTEAFHAGAAYLPEPVKDTIDAYNTTLQCSRRFIGLKLFMTLAELGEKGYSELIEKQARLGNLLRKKLTESGFEIKNNTSLPVVCFTHRNIGENCLTIPTLLEKLYRHGEFWISSTKLQNSIPVLRACISSFRTEDKDVNDLVDALTQIVNNISGVPAPAKKH